MTSWPTYLNVEERYFLNAYVFLLFLHDGHPMTMRWFITGIWMCLKMEYTPIFPKKNISKLYSRRETVQLLTNLCVQGPSTEHGYGCQGEEIVSRLVISVGG